MMLDAATLLDYFDATSRARWAAAGAIELAAEYEELEVPAAVVLELEVLVRQRFGAEG